MIWQTKKLGDVCDFFNGKAHEKCIDEKGDYIVVNSKFVSSEGQKYKRTKKQLFPLLFGDIAMVMSDVPNGKALMKGFLVDFDGLYTLNQRICVIRSEKFDNKFLFYQLNRNKYFLSFNNGENQTNLRKDDILNCPLIIFSFPEQRRIVKILDEVFEGIAKAKENAEKNLQNAEELFESYLNNIFENSGKNWEEKKLEEILEIERGGSPRPIQKYLTTNSEGINWIKIGDTKNVDKYILKTNQKIKPEGLKKSRLVNEGDFILSNSMSFGRPYIMKTTGAIHDGWLVLREKKKNIIGKDYLYNILSSPYVFNQFDELATGSTVRNLNISLVSSVKIPLPSIPEQKSIVKKLDKLSKQTKKLEAVYKQKISDLEELKKSVLKKAFSGEL